MDAEDAVTSTPAQRGARAEDAATSAPSLRGARALSPATTTPEAATRAKRARSPTPIPPSVEEEEAEAAAALAEKAQPPLVERLRAAASPSARITEAWHVLKEAYERAQERAAAMEAASAAAAKASRCVSELEKEARECDKATSPVRRRVEAETAALRLRFTQERATQCDIAVRAAEVIKLHLEVKRLTEEVERRVGEVEVEAKQSMARMERLLAQGEEVGLHLDPDASPAPTEPMDAEE